jgi:dihydrolipoamide dehydrogenase
MANKSYQVIVIGSGPGGYVAAIRAAQLGFQVALIEKYNSLGGTCLNVGCIPSKALLDYSEHYHALTHKFPQIGIHVEKVSLDLKQMIEQKRKVVAKTVEGIRFLMKKNRIDVYHGFGSFVDPWHVKVALNDGGEIVLKGQYIIIATGSKPATLPFITIDKKRIITSTEALELTSLPKTLIVIGGGVIGLELGSVFARLGSQVHVIEYMDRLLPTMDGELGREIEKILAKQLPMTFHLSHRVTGVEVKKKEVMVTAQHEGKEVAFKGDYCLVAIGRRPYTEGLNLEAAGLTVDEKGRIPVNGVLQTKQPHIFAIGDVIEGPMLAHKASEEGVFVAEWIAGKQPHLNYLAIPSVVYTWPEVASVGYTEEELQENRIPYKKGKFPYMASGRARASMDTEGFVKVLAHAETDAVLGIHMIGARVADLIMEGVMALEFQASAEDIALLCHPHPTYSEIVKEAALAATENRAIHI